jgi:hypothetical protein
MTDRATHARDFAKNLALEAAHKIQQAAGPQHAIEFKSGNWCSALDRHISTFDWRKPLRAAALATSFGPSKARLNPQLETAPRQR